MQPRSDLLRFNEDDQEEAAVREVVIYDPSRVALGRCLQNWINSDGTTKNSALYF